jgi:predicted HNH restriction endonuclease
MARINEEQLVLPTLYLLNSSAQGLTTSDLIRDLTVLFNPTGEDAEILDGRSDTKFSQKVRNLKSHDTLENLGYATFTPNASARGGSFGITEMGRTYLNANLDLVQYLFTNNFSSEDIIDSLTAIDQRQKEKEIVNAVVFDENFLIYEGNVKYRQSKVYERSSQLRNLAVEKYTIGGRIKCSVCCFDFEDFYGEYGKYFIEIHHQKPVFMLNEREYKQTLEAALVNVVPVCSNCHRMVHKTKIPLTIEEMKAKINQKLYFCT